MTLPISSSARAVSPLRIAAAGRDAGVPSTGVPVPTFDNDQMYAGGLRVGRSHCGCRRHAPARVRPYRQDWSAFAGRAGLFHGRCSSLLTGRGLHASGLFSSFGMRQPRLTGGDSMDGHNAHSDVSPLSERFSLDDVIMGLATDLVSVLEGRMSVDAARANAELAKQLFNGVRLVVNAQRMLEQRAIPTPVQNPNKEGE